MFLSGKVELIFDKLTDQGPRRFSEKLKGTYTLKTSHVLAAGLNMSVVMTWMYGGFSQIFPGFWALRSLRSSQSPVSLSSSLQKHSVQQPVSQGAVTVRWSDSCRKEV